MAPLLRTLLFLVLLVAGAGVSSGKKNKGPRVRKELRSLSHAEYAALITGLSTLNTIHTEQGRMLYGPKYISYTELLLKHAVAVNDPRGDQGHFGPGFMTFHRALLLELEEALLSVVPHLGALPYWDITLDHPGNKYYNTSEYIFSPKYAGEVEGDAKAGSGVTTGVFAWRQVGKFIPEQWPQYAKIFAGNAAGYLRSKPNPNSKPLVTRYLTETLLEVVRMSVNGTIDPDQAKLPFGNIKFIDFDKDYLLHDDSSGWVMKYPKRNFERCLNPLKYRKWMEWNLCLDLTVYLMANLTRHSAQKYVGASTNTTILLHTGVHWTVGSLGSTSDPNDQGDFFDVATSPNEMLLFATHHANIDRSAMTWQAAALKQRPGMRQSYWGFPATQADWPNAPKGCLLNDVLNSNAPFLKVLFSKPPAKAAGYTHGEVIEHTRPGASPYIYDSMLD